MSDRDPALDPTTRWRPGVPALSVIGLVVIAGLLPQPRGIEPAADVEAAPAVLPDVERAAWVLLIGLGVVVFIGLGLALGGSMLLGISAWTGRPVVEPVGRPEQARDWAYPARVEARLDQPLNRGLWLVKWLLLIPHLVVLVVLWAMCLVLTTAAAVAIVITGHYPRAIFDFNVGVLRWTWRVAYYGYYALGTDRYPPFTMEPAGYPATFEVAYPERVPRALVFLAWPLASPHLVLLVILVGVPLAFGATPLVLGGLVSALTLVAGALLLARGRYPRDLFDLIVGLDRWAFRVVVYLALMTDEYPPLRLDSGGSEPVAVRPRPVRGRRRTPA